MRLVITFYCELKNCNSICFVWRYTQDIICLWALCHYEQYRLIHVTIDICTKHSERCLKNNSNGITDLTRQISYRYLYHCQLYDKHIISNNYFRVYHQNQISWPWISDYMLQYSVRCNVLVITRIPTSGANHLISSKLGSNRTTRPEMRLWAPIQTKSSVRAKFSDASDCLSKRKWWQTSFMVHMWHLTTLNIDGDSYIKVSICDLFPRPLRTY